MDDDCIFCGIVDGNLDSYDVYEDSQTKAFLDQNPANDGHTLVVPKTHAEELTDLDDEQIQRLFTAARQVASRIEDRLDPDGINIMQSNGKAAGQEIFHVHVHVIPRYSDDAVEIAFNGEQLDEETAEAVLDRLQ